MPLNNPHYRPQRSLYQTITTKWLTLTNFAWFLGAVLTLVMLVLMAKSAKVLGIGAEEYPYEIAALSGIELDAKLRNTRTMGTLVFLYDSECKNCAKQMDSLLNLRSLEEKNQISLLFVSMDQKPMDAMNFLEEQRVPESMLSYYVAPQARVNIKTVLDNHGTPGVDYQFPHTILFGSDGRMIVEYKGYVRAQEIMRTLQLYKLQNRLTSED